MPSEIYNAQNHNFFAQDEVLLDANIWLYLEGPPGASEKLVATYSNLLERIIVQESPLVTAPLVLSEFANRYVRFHYNEWAHRREKSFKDYRKSAAFEPVLPEVSRACSNILGFCERTVRSAISLDELAAEITTFSKGSHDLNDLLLARLCQKEGLILVTHDADFAELDDLTIVTANKRLL